MMPRDETAVAIEKQTKVLQEIADGISEANEIARIKLERELGKESGEQEPSTPNS